MAKEIDLAIIGAGFSGLACARTYIELHPHATVAVFDAQDSVGGVWAKQRLYPGLKTNNILGTLEFSDFPIDEELQQILGVKPGDHIPGSVVHEYLTRYAKKFGVFGHIRFNTKVQAVEQMQGQGWRLHLRSGKTDETVLAHKLIIATGLHSQPFLPTFEGSDTFGAPLFHAKEFHQHAKLLDTSQQVVVLGGTKSAWDCAYEFAVQGVQVHMVIRESGHGPMWMCPPYVTPLKKRLELLATRRALTWMSPCIYGAADGYAGVRNWLHGTSIGRWIVDSYWKILRNDVLALNGYDKHKETKKLKPWSNPMFLGSGIAVLNYEKDFFQLVREGRIKVHIADITALSDRTVHLSSGDHIRADALICSTGWKYHTSIDFLPAGSDAKLGLPHYSAEAASAEDPSIEQIDKVILDKFPRLGDDSTANPKFKEPPTSPNDKWAPQHLNQPYRLYRFMVPPAFLHDRSIGFGGVSASLVTSLQAQTQALWLSAYFDGKLDIGSGSSHKSQDDDGDEEEEQQRQVEYETLLHARFGRWRYPPSTSHGAEYPDISFDSLPYLDLLLDQLGLRTHRKAGWLAEIFEPYMAADYRGLIEEWKEVQRRRGEK